MNMYYYGDKTLEINYSELVKPDLEELLEEITKLV